MAPVRRGVRQPHKFSAFRPLEGRGADAWDHVAVVGLCGTVCSDYEVIQAHHGRAHHVHASHAETWSARDAEPHPVHADDRRCDLRVGLAPQVGRLGNLRYITAGHEEGTPQQKLDRWACCLGNNALINLMAWKVKSWHTNKCAGMALPDSAFGIIDCTRVSGATC